MTEKTWDELTTVANTHPSALLGGGWAVKVFVSEVKSRKKGYGRHSPGKIDVQYVLKDIKWKV